MPCNVGCFGQCHLLLCNVSSIGLCLAACLLLCGMGCFLAASFITVQCEIGLAV